MKYILKCKMKDNSCYYINNSYMSDKYNLAKEGVKIEYFLLDIEEVKKLWVQIVEIHGEKLAELAIVKATNYEPIQEYETVQYRSFRK